MNKSRRTALYLAAAFAAFIASGPALGDTKADIAALEKVDQDWEKAFNSGNAEALAALYDENAVLLPPGSPAVKGRKAIGDYFRKFIEGASKAGVSFHLGAKPSGGVAGTMGWQSGMYTAKDKSGNVVESGKYLSVSEKKGGKWLYVRDAWNSDAAPPAPAPAPTGAQKK